jgi:hypothetical protein
MADDAEIVPPMGWGNNESFLLGGYLSDFAPLSDEFTSRSSLPVSSAGSNGLPSTADVVAGSWRGDETHHRVGLTQAGQWWWFDPLDGARVVAGVQGVNRSLSSEPILPQLEEWGFNLLGYDAAEGLRNRGAAYLHALELRKAMERPIHQDGVHLPDVFDSSWEESAEQIVNGVMPTASLAGYVSDRELSWGQEAEAGVALTRPTLLQVCLSLDPAFSAYHAAWEFVFAQRGGELSRLNEEWGLTLANKEALRQMTKEERPIDSPGYRVDLNRFTRQFALRYFGAVSGILRAIDPGRLWLSSPLSKLTPRAVREIAGQHCDITLVDEVGLGEGAGPELLVDVDWSQGDRVARDGDPVGMSDYERMMWRGREGLLAAIEEPQVVGYLWGNYGGGDLVKEGPFSGALLDEAGRINPANVEVLKTINSVAGSVRIAAGG